MALTLDPSGSLASTRHAFIDAPTDRGNYSLYNMHHMLSSRKNASLKYSTLFLCKFDSPLTITSVISASLSSGVIGPKTRFHPLIHM